MDGQGYVYLLIEREFRRPRAPRVFKVGRTERLARRMVSEKSQMWYIKYWSQMYCWVQSQMRGSRSITVNRLSRLPAIGCRGCPDHSGHQGADNCWT